MAKKRLQKKREATKTAAPKTTTPVTEAVTTEPAKVETKKMEPAKVETAKTEAPKVETKKVAPVKVETTKTEAPKVETKKVEPVKVETKKTDAPKIESHKEDTVKVETTKTDAPKVSSQKPAAEIPVRDDDAIYCERLSRHLDELKWLYCELYQDNPYVTMHLNDLLFQIGERTCKSIDIHHHSGKIIAFVPFRVFGTADIGLFEVIASHIIEFLEYGKKVIEMHGNIWIILI